MEPTKLDRLCCQVAVLLRREMYDQAHVAIEAFRRGPVLVAEQTTVDDWPIEMLGLRTSTENMLLDNGFRTVAQVAMVSDQVLMSLRRGGPAVVAEVRERIIEARKHGECNCGEGD